MEDVVGHLFTLAQFAQLHEIQSARLKRGLPGIGMEVAALIRRLTDGGTAAATSDDPRVVQAKRLWDFGFGTALGIESFESYLSTIFEIPEELKARNERFPHLVLVDARLGITKSCALAGLKYDGNDETFEDFDPQQTRPVGMAYWMRCQDGQKNRNKSVTSCRENFAADENGLTTMEGVALYVQHPEVIKGHRLDLPGSVHRGSRGRVAVLGLWDGEPRLDWHWGDGADPGFGSASRSAPRVE